MKSPAEVRAEREDLGVVAVPTHDLVQAVTGHPIIVRIKGGTEVLLRLMTADEAMQMHRESCAPFGMEPTMTFEQALAITDLGGQSVRSVMKLLKRRRPQMRKVEPEPMAFGDAIGFLYAAGPIPPVLVSELYPARSVIRTETAASVRGIVLDVDLEIKIERACNHWGIFREGKLLAYYPMRFAMRGDIVRITP